MRLFKPLVFIASTISITWFVAGSMHDSSRDNGYSPSGAAGDERTLSPIPRETHRSSSPETNKGKPSRLDVADGSMSSEKTQNSPAAPLITLKAGLLSVTIEDRPLRWVLDEISRQSGMMFETGPEISEQRVTDSFRDLPVERGLRRLLGPWDLFVYYGGDETLPQSVWVYPKGKGAALRPIPPDLWASTRELEEAFSDTDPQVRAQALQALAERKGNAVFGLLLPALDDPNDQIRSAALNAAASSNLEIAPETLSRLAQSDPAPNVRFLALAALSNYVDASPKDLDIMGIAINASADTDREVRALAKNLIDRLDP